ncbi:MAG: DUF5667 domain-containing protein [bacterium]|nr:DUF5667 domain-containing protein [bacterium]
MNDKNLLKKLNSLKEIKPDDNWKKDYREILYSQISAGNTDNTAKSTLGVILENLMPSKILADLARPAWAMALVCVFILIAGIGGVYATKNSRPGDSLYIAKIISEKAQLAVIFDEKNKAKLSLEFATNRAKEITQMLKDSGPEDGGDEARKDKLEKLSVDFKKEINQAKDNLASIMAPPVSPEGIEESQGGEEEPQVFGANLEKDDQGMEISESAGPSSAGEADPDIIEPLPENKVSANASSTPETAADKILEEAEKMFDQKDYDGALDKLDQVNKIVNEAPAGGAGEVKGASETASTTVNN